MKTLKAIHREADKISPVLFNNLFEKEKINYDFEHSVIIGLFEDLIGKVKSIIILIEEDHHFSIDSIARGVFENYVYLHFILLKESRLRARSYALSVKSREFKFYKTLTRDDKVGKEIREKLGLSNTEMDKIEEAKTKSIDKRKEIFGDVLKIREEKQKWFDLDGKTKSLEQLCRKLDMEVEYEMMYRMLSREVHSNDTMDLFEIKQLKGTDGYAKVGIKKNKNDITLPIQLCSNKLYDATKLVCDYYNLKTQKRKFETMVGINHSLPKG